MKESKLIEMQKRIETLGAAVNRLVQELTHLKDLSVGTMELVKKFPGSVSYTHLTMPTNREV